MRIEFLRVYRYNLPLCKPLVLKGVTHTRRKGLLVEIVTETGRSCWGEVAPLPGFSRESLEEAEQQVLTRKPKLEGRVVDVLSEEVEADAMANNFLAPSVRFGVELALSEATRVAGRRLPSPRAAHDFVPVNALMISGEVAAARELVFAGYRAVKLKVGSASVQEDVRMVRDVVEVAGEGVRVRLDANRSWSFEDAVAFVQGIEELPYEYIEEPLMDAGRMRRFVEQTGARVALDESLQGMDSGELESHRYASAVVLKPTFLGGLTTTKGYARQALALGMKPVISAAFESGVGTRAMALLASELGLTDTAMGLDTYRWLEKDVLEPRLSLKQGGFSVADLLNEGRHIRKELLSEVQ